MTRPPDKLIGRTFAGRYEILERLGEGGMGTVYKARQVTMDRLVALKVLHPELVRDEESQARFAREMKATSVMEHPHTVTVYDYGTTSEGETFLVMEMLKGQTLQDAIEDGAPFDTKRVVHICRQMAQALSSAHEKGIVHRDIKPENVMLLDSYGIDDWVKVLDFGIARLGEAPEGKQLTMTGTVLGTPAYMSPERARGESCDHRSDIYALGVLTFAMACGRAPFEATESLAVLFKHVSDPVPLLASKGGDMHPDWLDDVIAWLMAKEPDQRPMDASELVKILDAKIAGADIPVPGPGRAGSASPDEDEEAAPVVPAQGPPAVELSPSLQPAKTIIKPSSGYKAKKRKPKPAPPAQTEASSPQETVEDETPPSPAPSPAPETRPAPPRRPSPPDAGVSIEKPTQRDEPARYRSVAKTSAAPLPQKPSTTRNGLVALLLLVVVGVAGYLVYADTFGPSTQGTQAAGAAGGGAAGAPIKVGVIFSHSGGLQDQSAHLTEAVHLAITQLNETGGVMNRPVEAIVVDGRSNPPHAAREAERLMREDKVLAVFGCRTSDCRKALKPVVEAADNLLIFPGHYEGLEASPNILYTGATPQQNLIPAVTFAFTDLGARRFFLIGGDNVYSRGAHEQVRDLLKKLGGKVQGELLLKKGDEVSRKVVRSFTRKKTRIDFLINTLPSDASALLFRELRASGIKPAQVPTLSVNVSEHELKAMETLELQGDFLSRSYYESSEGAKSKAFVASFKEKFGQHRLVTSAIEAAYSGVHLWAAAVDKAQNTSPKAVRAALKGLTFNGPAGQVAVEQESLHLERMMEIKQIGTSGSLNTVHSSNRRLLATPFPDSRSRVVWEEFVMQLYRDWDSHWEAKGSD